MYHFSCFKAKDFKNKEFAVYIKSYREHILLTFYNSFCATYMGQKKMI